MAPMQSESAKKRPSANDFFVPASQRPRREVPAQDYNHMANNDKIDPPSSANDFEAFSSPSISNTSSASSFTPPLNTIVVDAPPSHKDYLSDNKAEDLPTPTFARQNITDKKKIKACKR
jgi:hypothetical protein